MGMVNTTLGLYPVEQMGKTNVHEHLIIEGNEIERLYPDFIHDDVALLSGELSDWKKAGGGVIVDCSPICAGRSVEKTVQLSNSVKLPVIMSTGFHKQFYYAPDHWIFKVEEDVIFDIMHDEFVFGLMRDENDPFSGRRFVQKAGALKVAVDENGLTPFALKIFSAAVQVINRLHIPLFIHTEPGTPYLYILNWLSEKIKNMAKVVFCHMDKSPNKKILDQVSERGAYLEFDSMVRNGISLADLVDLINRLPRNQVLFGGDLARRSYWKCYAGSPGLAYLITDLDTEFFDLSVSSSLLSQIWEENPSRLFS